MLATLTNIKSFITRTAYRREIITILILKLAAIFLLWYLFFSHPVSHNLNLGMLTNRYLG